MWSPGPGSTYTHAFTLSLPIKEMSAPSLSSQSNVQSLSGMVADSRDAVGGSSVNTASIGWNDR